MTKFMLTASRTATALFLVCACSGQAYAQEAAPADDTSAASEDAVAGASDIVVTARRRSEQLIDVPVVVSAFSGEQLDKAGVQNISDIAKMTPLLVVEQGVSAYGGIITLRGVSSPTSSTAAEPAVTINIDGVPISYGHVVRLGQLDIGQVEILKGPQALYYGKNASGGIISLRSADPTEEFDFMVRGEYEFGAEQLNIEGFVSGPIANGVRARIAGKVTGQDGYVTNDFPGVRHPEGPGTREETVRGTLIIEPSDRLSVRLKGTYDNVRDDGNLFLGQRVYCQFGVPSGPSAVPGITDCKPDGHTARQDMPVDLAQQTGDLRFRDGVPYSEVEQAVLSADINWKVADGIALNAISGYYWVDQGSADPLNRGFSFTYVTAGGKKRTYSQEVRLFSDNPDARFDWMLGGFYQNDEYLDHEHVVAKNVTTGVLTNNQASEWDIDSELISGFAQGTFRFDDRLSLSGGARYTHETKRQSVNLSDKFIPKVTFENISPEATLAYRVNPDVNLFASYKQGFKSGGFQVTSLTFRPQITNPAITQINNAYKEEVAKGFEAGVKAQLLDRTLRVNLAAYRYNYSDLQVSSYDPATLTTRINNAAAARVQGVEFDFNYVPRDWARGLSISGGLAYNHARYRDYVGACYVGQTIAEGCTIKSLATLPRPDQQSLDGSPLMRAPNWSGSIGLNYEAEIGSNLVLTANARANWQTASFIAQEEAPWMVRPQMTVYDAGLALANRSGSWEVALIGKNLTNEYYSSSGAQITGTGVSATTGTAGPGLHSDFTGVVNRGQEIWLRLTLRPTRR